MRTALAIPFLLTSLSMAHAAGPLNTFRVGAWNAGVYTDDKSGRFSHCAAATRYRSQITLFVTVTRDYQWGLAFSNPQWNLTPGQRFPINLAFDDRPIFRVFGNAQSRDFVIVPMPNESNLISAFRAANFMKAFAQGEQFLFSLDGTSRLLLQLVQCVARNSAPAGVATNNGTVERRPNPAPSARTRESEQERDRLIAEAAAEHAKCTQGQMRQIVPYSSENAEVLAQVILTNCREAENRFVSLGVALFNAPRAEVERIVGAGLAEQKKRMVADIVTFRAELARALLNESKNEARPQSPDKTGI
jgi:hypothetical protein